MKLPEKFLERMQKRLGKEYPAFLSSYENPPYKGLRINTLKIGVEEFLQNAPFPLGEQVDWEWTGFYHTQEKAGAFLEHFAGLYYLQEPSAMSVGEMTNGCKKERVLDLCAAPGGKTTLVAAQMAGDGILIANEIDKGRAKILSQNVERMGIQNCAVVSSTPERLAQQFVAYFDLILVDAPCSGEGMFKKEPNAIPEWSEENVRRCAERQRDILDCAAKMLAGGGTIIYSTCTFAEEEDEWQIEDFLKRHPEFFLYEDGMDKLYPHEVKGEGHFVAALKKSEGEQRSIKPYPVRRNMAANKAFKMFAQDFLTESAFSVISPRPFKWQDLGRHEHEVRSSAVEKSLTTLADGRMFLLPPPMPAIDAYILRLGVELGEFDGRAFKPAHALAMSLKREQVKRFIELSPQDCERYLAGETLAREIENGWCVVGFKDYPLGLCKAVNGVLKNHLPKGLRKVKSVK